MTSRRGQGLARACVWGALLAASRLSAQTSPEPAENVEAREEYFWGQRAYPSTARPYEAMLRARQAMSMRASSARSVMALGSAGSAASVWRPIGPVGVFDSDGGFYSSGPQLDAGRVTGIAPSATGGPLIIATASGGVWRSVASGASWTPLTDTQCALTTGAVSRDPVNPNIVYAGTGEYNVNSLGCGILRSTDGGSTWTLTGATSFRVQTSGSAGFASIYVDPAGAGTVASTVLLAASNLGVYRSPDGGATWAIVLSGATASVIAHPTKTGVRFAGNSDNFAASQRGVYRSTDGGSTWSALPIFPNVVATAVGRIELAVSPAAPDRIHALVASRTNNRILGLFVWDDGKAQWESQPFTGLYTGASRADFGTQSSYNFAIAIDPRDAKRVYVAGVRAFRSIDGGATFRPMAMEIHCDWHRIVIDPRNPDILYAGTDGGVFVSADAGDTWTSRNAGLAIAQYYPGVSVAPDGARVLGGSQDNGSHEYTGSSIWNGYLGGDGGYTIINYNKPDVVYGEAQWSPSGAYIYQRDGRGVYSYRAGGIVSSDRGAFIPPFIIDPNTPTTLYFATQRLYRTRDEGRVWIPISGDLTRGTGQIRTIAAAKSDTLTVYVGTSDAQVQVTRDGGVTFTNVSTGLPNRVITRVAVDPADAAHALVTVSGFGTGHVWETVNAGTTWKDIAGTRLIDAPANAVSFVPGVGIMVGTDVGVFLTADGGATWDVGPAGLPNVIVQDLVYAPATKLVVVGTYGRGMFAFNVGTDVAVLRGDVSADGKVDAFDALLIQQAITGVLPQGLPVMPRGDANCNGFIEAADVLLVLRTAVGLPTGAACVNTVR